MRILDKARDFVERWVPMDKYPGRNSNATGELAKLMRLVFRAGTKEEHPGMDRGTVFGETFEDIEAVLRLCDEQDIRLSQLPERYEGMHRYRGSNFDKVVAANNRAEQCGRAEQALRDDMQALALRHREELSDLRRQLKDARGITIKDSPIETLNVTDGSTLTVEKSLSRPGQFRRSRVEYSLEPRDDCQYLQDLGKTGRSY